MRTSHLVGCLLSVVLLAVCVALCVHIRRESEIQYWRAELTRTELEQVKMLLLIYLAVEGTEYPSNLNDALIKGNGGALTKDCDGVDVWGQQLVLEESSNDPQIWLLRSVGPNRVDDKGKGDDIQIEIDLRVGSSSRLP